MTPSKGEGDRKRKNKGPLLSKAFGSHADAERILCRTKKKKISFDIMDPDFSLYDPLLPNVTLGMREGEREEEETIIHGSSNQIEFDSFVAASRWPRGVAQSSEVVGSRRKHQANSGPTDIGHDVMTVIRP